MVVAVFVRGRDTTRQRESGKQFAAEHGWTAAIYEDRARLLADAKRRRFQAVWVKDQTRLSRSTAELSAILKHLFDHGCLFVAEEVKV